MKKIKIIFSESFWIDDGDDSIQKSLDGALKRLGNKVVVNIQFVCNPEGRGEFWIYATDK